MGSKWVIEKFTRSNDFGLWKVKMIRFGLERRWNNTQHQPGEAVIRILRFGLERRCNNTQHQPGEAVIRILRLGLERRWNNTQVTAETTTLVEGGVIHLEDGKACKVQVEILMIWQSCGTSGETCESHSGNTGLNLWWRNLGLRWSLLLVRLEEDKQSTIALGYLGDREESNIVGPKKCIAMETLWMACGTYLKFQVGSKRFFRRTNLATPGAEDGTVQLVDCPKNPRAMKASFFGKAVQGSPPGGGASRQYVCASRTGATRSLMCAAADVFCQQKTRVNRVTSWEDSGVGETFYHLGKHFLIEFLGHGKKFGTWWNGEGCPPQSRFINTELDTITQSQSLQDGSTLLSKGGIFELGFFNLGNSTNRYVGIWYKNIPVRRVVWVANRDNPVKDNSSKLIISRDGNLALVNQNQTILWSTNTTTKIAISSLIVQLLDDGNLVLKNEKQNNTNENFLWQSFDYPSDTILPGMKAGWDIKKGLDRNLVAWKNWDDPSSSDFTSAMVLTPNPESFIWKGSRKLYRTGPWTGPRSSGIVGLTENPIYDYEFVNNEDEVYYMFTLKNISVVSIVVLNRTSSVRQRIIWISESKTWNAYLTLPQDSCDVYNICGNNGLCALNESPVCQCLDGFKPKSPQQWNATDWSQGCVPNGNWSCGVKNRDGFKRIAAMKLPDTTHSWIDEKMTLENCKAKCLENCSCSAYSSLDSTGTGSGCSIWFGDLIDLRVSQSGQDLYIRIDSSDIGKIEKTTTSEEKEEDKYEDFELPIFDQATILKATNNFSFENKLGEGGFGPVYKGTLLDGQEIAVKRLSRSSGQGIKEFKNEVILCAKLQHRNLVKVVGCCIEGEEKMLIYEYMSNKSLDSFLFDPFQNKLLDWSTRFNILFGIARGLLYLHEDSRLRIIHRDMKVSNILLDDDMNPKISDFGMARMCGGDQIEGRTNRIVGTYGKKNRADSYQEHDHNLIGYAWRLWKEGKPFNLIDDYLRNSCIESEALRCIQIGLLCLQHHPDDRPNMASVVVMLSSENTLLKPKEPGLLIRRFSVDGEPSPERQTSSSTNEITISRIDAR
ncbi:hypothetical protein TSUD_132320 [Trifolium subterraneum]|uniref:non-specific serine/threonine protein kinase n=1 Tax=Trifolium subterraneum TaxID=3900 RepID=A0A2Z6PUS7_TRISU|nr:hypothetical protein TSUD_132320 [Trifolium subterraneum]